MSAVTIDIPAEHVETIRRHLLINLSYVASDLQHAADSEKPAAARQAVEHVHSFADAIEQIGWEGAGERTLTGARGLLAEPFGDALQYAKDDVSSAETDKLDALMARIKWLSETLNSFEPEKVGAA